MTAIANFFFLTKCSACSPFSAITTSNPDKLSQSLSDSLTIGSSSTIRTVRVFCFCSLSFFATGFLGKNILLSNLPNRLPSFYKSLKIRIKIGGLREGARSTRERAFDDSHPINQHMRERYW